MELSDINPAVSFFLLFRSGVISFLYFLFNIIVIMRNFHYNIGIEKTACGITRKPFLNSFFKLSINSSCFLL